MTPTIPKPEVAPPVWDNIPAALAGRKQWLLWKYEWPETKPGRKPPTKWQKIPYYVAGGRRTGDQGGDRDRGRLAVLDAVRKAYLRGGWDGVGFGFLPDDGLIGIDIDGAIDPDSGEVSERCLEIVRACDSFTEYSPSGKGVHIFVTGDTDVNKCDSIGLELYCKKQFFTITARRWENVHHDVRAIRPEVLQQLNDTINAAKEADKAAKEAAKPAKAPKPAKPQATAGTSGDAEQNDFAKVNAEAMNNFDAWVPALFPSATAYKGGYRVTSSDLGRDLQEDLAIHPDGIKDFGLEETFTPIDLVMRWLPASKPREALVWLAQRLGVQLRGPKPKPASKPAQAASSGGAGGNGPPDDEAGHEHDDDDEGGAEIPVIRMIKGKGNKNEDCRENVLYCMRADPHLRHLVALNQFTEQQDKTRAPPWPGGEPGEWTEEDDLMLGEYLARVHKLLIKGASTIRAGVQMAARENKHHPIAERLRAVKWDGTQRLESWMVDCLGVTDRPYVRKISRFFIMGMVARVLRPGCKFDYMLIFQGAQGLGKSTAFRALADPYFMDTPFRIGDKDSYLSLQGVWLVEFSELESMSKAESTAIKAFVSSTEDRFRPPYGSRMVKMPRRAVLAGTTNGDQFLKDSTGDRRMWPVQVTEVRADLIAACRDQLFAEALHYLESEDAEVSRYYPTRDEEREYFHAEQDRWRMVDVWTDVISDFLDRETVPNGAPISALPPATRGFFTAQEIFADALKIPVDRMDNAKLMQVRVGNAMRELGFQAAREPTGARKRGYLRPGWEFEPKAGLRPIPGWKPPQGAAGPAVDAAPGAQAATVPSAPPPGSVIPGGRHGLPI